MYFIRTRRTNSYREEILNLFNIEELMCNMKLEELINNYIKIGKSAGFFCEIEIKNIPLKY